MAFMKTESQMRHAAEFINESMSWTGQVRLLVLMMTSRQDLMAMLELLSKVRKTIRTNDGHLTKEQQERLSNLLNAADDKFQSDEHFLSNIFASHGLSIDKVLAESEERDLRAPRTNVRGFDDDAGQML
jgi:hypothetical protein